MDDNDVAFGHWLVVDHRQPRMTQGDGADVNHLGLELDDHWNWSGGGVRRGRKAERAGLDQPPEHGGLMVARPFENETRH